MNDKLFNQSINIANRRLGKVLEDLLIEELITKSPSDRRYLRDIRNQLEICSTILKHLQRSQTETLEFAI